MNETLLISMAIFAVFLTFVLWLKSKLGSKLEIKNADILLALIPVLLWTLFTGKLSKLEIGGILSVEAAFTQAAQSAVAPDVSSVSELPVENVPAGEKGGYSNIPRLIEKRAQALNFQMGQVTTTYNGGAIEEYLGALLQHPYLRYIVINEADGTFFGMFDARQFNFLIHASQNSVDVYAFAEWLNSSQKASIEAVPGFIGMQQALRKTLPRGAALEAMESADATVLPAIDESSRFIGVVERSRLTAGMLLEVTEALSRQR